VRVKPPDDDRSISAQLSPLSPLPPLPEGNLPLCAGFAGANRSRWSRQSPVLRQQVEWVRAAPLQVGESSRIAAKVPSSLRPHLSKISLGQGGAPVCFFIPSMSLHSTPLDQVTLASLEQLTRSKARESRFIDYKSEWNLGSDRAKMEFLADVSAFANTEGGLLVYGMTEKDGVAHSIDGLKGFARDQEQLRAEHVLARGLEPRLESVEFAQVDLADDRIVFLVRISRSANGPHMVSDNGRFYRRIAGGRLPMDVEEVRAAFTRGPQAGNRADEFRRARVELISAGKTGARLWTRSVAVLHFVPQTPVKALDVRRGIDLPELRPPGQISGYDHQMTRDGLLVPSHIGDGTVASYVRLFKDGSIEAVLAGISANQRIDAAYEGAMRQALDRCGKVVTKLGIPPPFMAMLTLVNVQGHAFWREPSGIPLRRRESTIESTNLLLPAVAVEVLPFDVDALLKPAFDEVWHACGSFGSPHFDEAGHWRKGTREL